MKRAEITTIYRILANPYPIRTAEIRELLGCSTDKAIRYKKDVQDAYQAKLGESKKVNPEYVTREMLLEYEGWSWDAIRREALDLIAIQSRAQ
jgi:hypothetical protein